MGALLYGAAASRVDVPDEVLTHLEALIAQKLRRHEAFSLRWIDASGRRGSVWIHPEVDLIFTFDGDRTGTLDRLALERMAQSASSNAGLDLGAQPVSAGSASTDS